MAPPRNLTSPSQYWGIITSAVTERLTTASLWDQIRGFEAEQGITRPAGLFKAVTAMRSLAASQRRAREALTGAADSVAITADHIAQDINSRPLLEQALAPAYHVRFKATMLVDGQQVDQWLTTVITGILPATKGDLMGQVASDALAMSTSYQQMITGLTGDVQITAV